MYQLVFSKLFFLFVPPPILFLFFEVKGFETKCGSKLPPKLFSQNEEFSLIKPLRSVGKYEITGKATTTTCAWLDPSNCLNPHDVSRTPGGKLVDRSFWNIVFFFSFWGSSSGSAAGVSLGLFDLALGSQTVGST